MQAALPKEPRLGQCTMARRVLWTLLVGGSSFLGGMAGVTLLKHLESPAFAQGRSATLGNPVVTDVIAVGERFELVAKKVSPAVVSVEARKPSEKPGSKRTIEESGSGVLVNWPGQPHPVVLTNNHVVAGAGAERIMLHLADGRVLQPRKVLADPESDVAILTMEESSGLPTAELGDSDRLQVGHWVLAIGSPFGLNQSVTHGILSAKGRGQIGLGATIRIKDFLQTDAAINPGSSGGPLVNLNGEVVGINTAIASTSGIDCGIAFAIPINLVRRIGQELFEKGRVSRGYLGIQLGTALEPALALRLGLDRVNGAVVEVVYPQSPAAAAGLKEGDVILEIDNQVIRNENHFINTVSALPPGKSIALVVWREQRKLALTATVGDWERAPTQMRPAP